VWQVAGNSRHGRDPKGREVNIMKMFRRKDEGFTLVELMVVVLIIGILIAIAIPVFNAARDKAEERTCHSNQRMIEGAFQTYYASNEVTSVALGDYVPDFIAETPYCPDEDSAFSSDTTGNGHADGYFRTDGVNADGSVDACYTAVDGGGTLVHGSY
jgi:type IV pilus assembly protein PilA